MFIHTCIFSSTHTVQTRIKINKRNKMKINIDMYTYCLLYCMIVFTVINQPMAMLEVIKVVVGVCRDTHGCLLDVVELDLVP